MKSSSTQLLPLQTSIELHVSVHDTVLPHRSSMTPHSAPAWAQVRGMQAQSLSFAKVQPAGQHPSALMHAEIGDAAHCALQVAALPVSTSLVHALPSLHEVGQLPSHVSPASMVPLPQVTTGAQSLSRSFVQPAGQQPSPDVHERIGSKEQRALQAAALPDNASAVHVF